MHTTSWKDDDEDTTWVFQHNGDFSGDVQIRKLKDDDRGVPHVLVMGDVPFEAVKHLVAQYVMDEKTRRLENAGDDALLMGWWEGA